MQHATGPVHEPAVGRVGDELHEHEGATVDGTIRMTTENLRVLTETVSRSPASLIRGIKVADRKPGDIQK